MIEGRRVAPLRGISSLATRQEQFLYLTTQGWKTGRPHEIEIWFVEFDGKYYVLSEMESRSHWIQNAMRNPNVSFRVGAYAAKATARVVDRANKEESALVGQVAALMQSKYGWSGGLILELSPRTDP
jgi:deazaflavin-dependent oxidoreductase (nitroreductase family)